MAPRLSVLPLGPFEVCLSTCWSDWRSYAPGELLDDRFQHAPVSGELHRLGAADFLIDLGTRLDTVRPLGRCRSATHFTTVLLKNVLTELTGSVLIIERQESVR